MRIEILGVLLRLLAMCDGALQVTHELWDGPVTLELQRHSVRAAGYRVIVDGPRGTRMVPPGPARTRREKVGGVSGTALGPLRCGVAARRQPPSQLLPGRLPGRLPRRRPPDTVCAVLACDADYEYFQRWGSVAAVEDRINAIVNFVNLQYGRDLAVRHLIGSIIVRTRPDDPYTATSAVTLTGQLRDQWLDHHGDLPRDLVHLFTGRDLDGSVIGYAWQLGSVCTDGAFCVVQSDFTEDFARTTDLTAHELGHLWGATHCSCLSPPFTMNAGIAGANVFHPEATVPDIAAIRDRVACLEPCHAAPCAADCARGDGLVGTSDLLALLATWGEAGACDLTGDGLIDERDLVLLLAQWGPCGLRDSEG